MLQQFILERMIKIVPRQNRLYELLRYDEYWHRYDGKVTDNHAKTLYGEIFKEIPDEQWQENHYKCDNIENFKEMPICPNCLKIWYEKIEKEFEDNQLLGNFELSLWEKNALFLKMFIENEGYDKLNVIINEQLFDYLQENSLIGYLEKKSKQKEQ